MILSLNGSIRATAATAKLITLSALILLSLNVWGQTSQECILIAPMEYAQYSVEIDAGRIVAVSVVSETGSNAYLAQGEIQIQLSSISRYLFDLDDDIEFLYIDSHFDAFVYDETNGGGRSRALVLGQALSKRKTGHT